MAWAATPARPPSVTAPPTPVPEHTGAPEAQRGSNGTQNLPSLLLSVRRGLRAFLGRIETPTAPGGPLPAPPRGVGGDGGPASPASGAAAPGPSLPPRGPSFLQRNRKPLPHLLLRFPCPPARLPSALATPARWPLHRVSARSSLLPSPAAALALPQGPLGQFSPPSASQSPADPQESSVPDSAPASGCQPHIVRRQPGTAGRRGQDQSLP